jgi:hypothetical protein
VRRRRQRWRCVLCDTFGYADTADERLTEFERHYRDKHREGK